MNHLLTKNVRKVYMGPESMSQTKLNFQIVHISRSVYEHIYIFYIKQFKFIAFNLSKRNGNILLTI